MSTLSTSNEPEILTATAAVDNMQSQEQTKLMRLEVV